MPYSYMLASCQDYQIRQQGEVTWEQGPIRALASNTLQRNLISTTSWGCPEHLLAAISWHWLRLACSGWPAGFHSMFGLLSFFSASRSVCSFFFRVSYTAQLLFVATDSSQPVFIANPWLIGIIMQPGIVLWHWEGEVHHQTLIIWGVFM